MEYLHKIDYNSLMNLNIDKKIKYPVVPASGKHRRQTYDFTPSLSKNNLI